MLRRAGGHAVSVGKFLTKSKKRMLLVGLLVLASGVVIAQCGGGGGGNGGGTDTDGDGHADSGIRIASAGAEIIARNAPIVFVFATSMDRTTLILAGAIADASDGGVWSESGTETLEDDTLTISPLTTWPVGFDQALKTDIQDFEGNVIHAAFSFDVFVKVWYVHPDGTDVDGGGSAAGPYRTIQYAIDNNTNGISSFAILVAEGTYASAYDQGDGDEVIFMRPGFSVYGGYSDSDWSLRDPRTYVTTLSDVSSSGGSPPAPSRAVTVPAPLDFNTHLEGFTIRGGSDEVGTMAALVVEGGSATIRDNVILGASAPLTMGIYMQGSCAPRIENNAIDAGTGSAARFGIKIEGCDAQITGNAIRGGTGATPFTYGIHVSAISNPEILNNGLIHGGGGSEQARGVYIEEPASGTYEGNTIVGGDSDTLNSTGIMIASLGATPNIANNTVDGGSGEVYATGIWNTAGDGDITGNTITVSAAAAESITRGLYVNGGAPRAIGNSIQGGGGFESYGIIAESSEGGDLGWAIFNNTIHGGSAATSVGVWAKGHAGIELNTIYSGGGTASAVGIRVGYESSFAIDNNIILSRGGANSTCVEENTETSDGANPTSFGTNDLYNCQTLYFDDGDTAIILIGSVPGTGNVSANPGFADYDGADDDLNTMPDNNWRIKIDGSSPCAVTRGGDPTPTYDWEIGTDKDGTERSPAPGYSMGAYEYDGACAE